MKAKDVMTTAVISIGPDTDVRTIAALLLEQRISAVPVVDAADLLVGIVSEGDLIRRPELKTERARSWWLDIFDHEEMAVRYLKSHGLRARDVMTRDVVTVTEDTPLTEIATLFERKRIKRVPVLRFSKVVGIVSRADLLHGLLALGPRQTAQTHADRDAVIAELRSAGLASEFVNVVVADGAVQLWGGVNSVSERAAIQLAAERTPGVRRVENYLFVIPPHLSASLGAL